MPFWIAAVAVALAVAALLLLALRTRPETGEEPANVRVYRDQLREVERDLARGTIAPDEAERLRTEISRRLLEADRAEESGAARGAPLLAAGAIVAAMVAAFALYLNFGAPDYPDMPLSARLAAAEEMRAHRPSQQDMQAMAPPLTPPDTPDAGFLELMDKLRAAVQANPQDMRGQELLVRNESALGRFAEAAMAQRAIITLKAESASADDYADLADLLILAAGGGVSSEAETALTESLRRDPSNQTARFYSGLMLAQTGRPDLAFRLWRDLLETSPPDSPWVPAIRQDLPRLAALAGENYELPPLATGPLAGPSADDIAAAQDMSPEERDQMIRGMVDGLSARLSRDGGTAQDWARLISSLAVLGDRDKATAVWAEAQEVFAARATELALVRSAAEQAGLTQ